MCTSYYLTIGYISGYSCRLSNEEAWQQLLTCVERLRRQPERIVAEARRFQAPETCPRRCCTLFDVATWYNPAVVAERVNTLVIKPAEHAIVQLTTGDRELKEHVRRAFCRLVIEEMHRLGVEVCLDVV